MVFFIKSFFTLTHARMLAYPNRSDRKRKAIIIIYEKPICFVTASCYSSYCIDEELQYFAFWFLSMQCLLKKKKKPLILYFFLGPLAALHNPCNSANRSNNATKHREVFQKTQHTKVLQGVVRGFREMGWQKELCLLIPSSTGAELKMQ